MSLACIPDTYTDTLVIAREIDGSCATELT